MIYGQPDCHAMLARNDGWFFYMSEIFVMSDCMPFFASISLNDIFSNVLVAFSACFLMSVLPYSKAHESSNIFWS